MGHRQRLAPARRNPAPAAAPAASAPAAPRRDAPACRHGNPYPPRAATAMRRPGPCQRRARGQRQMSGAGTQQARQALYPRPAQGHQPGHPGQRPGRSPGQPRAPPRLCPPGRRDQASMAAGAAAAASAIATVLTTSRPGPAAPGAMPQRRQLRIAPMTRVRQVVDDLVLDARRPLAQHHDAGRHEQRFLDVVRHQQRGEARALPQVHQLGLHGDAGQRIQLAQGLVQDQDARVIDQRARQRRALRHAA